MNSSIIFGLSLCSFQTLADDSKYVDVRDLKDFRGTVYCPNGIAQNPAVKGRSHRWPSDLFEKVKSERDQGNQMNKIKAEYCNGSTPRAPIVEKVRFIIPKIPSGLALDMASEMTKNYIKSGRERVKNLFWELSFLSANETSVEPSCKNSSALSYVTLLPMTDSEDIDTRYKRETLDSVHLEEIAASLKNGDDKIDKTQPTILVSATVGSESMIHLLPNRVASFPVISKLDEMTGQVHRTFNEESMSSYNEIHTKGFFVIPQTIGIKGSMESGAKKVNKYPVLRLAQHLESLLFRRYFVLVMPREAQKEAFLTPRYFGLDEQGELKPSKLLDDREEEWRTYFEKFTAVKEAPGSDPSVIDFEVELNTALFCQYAKPVTQFLSR